MEVRNHLAYIKDRNQKARLEGKQKRVVPSGHRGLIELTAEQIDSRTVLELLDGFLYLLQLEDSGFDPDHPDYVPSETVQCGIEMYAALKDLVDMSEAHSHSGSEQG
jgi:hypothetical protein